MDGSDGVWPAVAVAEAAVNAEAVAVDAVAETEAVAAVEVVGAEMVVVDAAAPVVDALAAKGPMKALPSRTNLHTSSFGR